MRNRRSIPARAIAIVGILLILAVMSVLPRSVSVHAAGLTLVVNSTGDLPDVTLGDGVCQTDVSGQCTLRAAVEEANASPGQDQIAFSIGGGGAQVIQPGSPLPTIADTVVIDGTTEPGFAGTPIIDLDGTIAGSGNGLTITARTTVRGLAVHGFPGEGIRLDGSGAGGSVIQGNYIGTDTTGTGGVGNALSGIYVYYAGNAIIGGANAGEGNLISNNQGWAGISICGNNVWCGGSPVPGGSADSNQVLGNVIGLSAVGAAMGNHNRGISVDGAANTTVSGNVVSANWSHGIFIGGTSQSTGNIVFDNKIGVGQSGAGVLGNGGDGVVIVDGAFNNDIGAPAHANIIAHSARNGVAVDGASSTGNRIRGNSIYSNTLLGIALTNGGNNLVAPPAITTAGSGVVSGTACAGCLVDVFSDAADEGAAFEGEVAAGADGSWTLSASPSGPNLTATSTYSTADTSQFSAAVALASLPTPTPTATNTPTPTDTPTASATFTPTPTATTPPSITNLALDVMEASIPAGAASVPIKNIPIEAIPPAGSVPAAPLSSIDMRSSPLSSIPLSSIPLSSIPLSSIPLSSIPISTPGGWDAILAGTILANSPLQTVTLQQLLALNPAPAGLSTLTLGDIDLSSTALRGIGLASVALGPLPLSSIPIGPSGIALDDWCALLAGLGRSCASLGIDAGTIGSTSLLSVNLQGVPLSSIPLSSIPLSSIPLSSIPLSSIPLSSIPLSSIPLSSIPLSSIPLSSIPLSSIPLSSIPLSSISVPGGGSFCAYFDTGATTCAALGLTDASSMQALLSALQVAGIGPSSTPLSSIPLSSIPLSSIPLSSIPLSSILLAGAPLSSIGAPVAGGDFCAYFDTGPITCATLGISNTSTLHDVLQALAFAVPAVDPATTPLSSIPLSSIPLSSIPLSSIPLSSIPLSSIPLSSIPLSSISVNGTPLSSIPLSSIPLSSIPLSSIPLSSIPLSSIGNVVNCAMVDCATQTLGDAVTANAILPGATLGQLSVYGATTVQDILSAMGATPDQVAFALSFFFGDLNVGQANGANVNLGGVTLGQILMALLIRSDYPWETLPLDQMGVQDFAGSPASLDYRVGFLYGGPGAATSVSVTLPAGFRYNPGSSSINVVHLPVGYALLIGDPAIDGTTLTWTFPGGFASGDNVQVEFRARPGLELGTFTASASVSTAAVSASVVNQAPVTVTENFEPNADPATAPIISPDTLYISHISHAGDIDYFRVKAPTIPGARISVYLSHQATDGDLVLYRPGATALRPSTPVPDQQIPLDDVPPDLAGIATPPPQTLQDVPLSSIPLSSISANRGDSDESVAASSPDAAGYYTIQVSGYNGGFSDRPYVLRVKITPPPPVPQCSSRTFPHAGQGTPGTLPASIPGNVNTFFLVDQKRLGDTYGAADAASVMSSLATLAGRGDLGVIGAVIPVEGNPDVQAAYDAWDLNPCSPDAANAVVTKVNTLVDNLRSGHPGLQNIVLVGTDEIIPLARVPDMARVANESNYAGDVGAINGNNAVFGSMATSNILSDDPYADFNPTPWLNRQLFVPDVAVGRLVETPQDINNQINQFIVSNGNLDPKTALSTGYDFLSDGANAIADALNHTVAPNLTQRLIGEAWTRSDLVNAFTGAATPPDIDSINSHFDHYRALPAIGNQTGDQSDLFTTDDVLSAPASLADRVIFSMGCHSGLNVANVLVTSPAADQLKRLHDWPEAFSTKGAATYVGNTGFGYGDTDTVAYTEKLMQMFAQRMDGSMTIGQALTFAKQDYFGQLVQVEAYDEKVLTESTFYGLPMFTVGAPLQGPPVPPPNLPFTVDPGTGLNSTAISATPSFSRVDVPGRGSYYTIDGNADVTSGRPIQPTTRYELPAGPNGEIAHGVMLTGLQSVDEPAFDAIFSQPAIDVSTLERPVDAVFPEDIPALSTFNTPSGQRQRLVLMPGQYIPDNDPSTPAGVGVERRYTSVGALVLYSNSGDFTAPTVLDTRAALIGGDVAFTVDARDDLSDNVRRVTVLFHDLSNGQWRNVDLVHDAGTDRWTGGAPVGGQVQYMAFAVDAAGNVATTTNKGDLYAAVQPSPPAGLSVTVDGAPAPANTGWLANASITVSGTSGVVFDYSIDGAASVVYTAPFPVTGDGVHFVDVRGSDGSEGTAIVAIDGSAPSIAITTPANGGNYSFNQVVTAQYSCADAGSGVSSCIGTVANGGAIDTSTLGTKTFAVNAVDVAGNVSSASVTYTVVPWTFTGFFSPVENRPVLNVVKAGNSVPMKWQLQDQTGTFVTSLSAVTKTWSWPIDCASQVESNVVPDDALASGSSGLQYDPVQNQYVFAWKTAKSWRGSCSRFVVQLADGTYHGADFSFK